MFRLEGHDSDLNRLGTLHARLKNGADYAYQIEMYVRDMVFEPLIRRLYVFDSYGFDRARVLAVYASRSGGAVMHYVGRDQRWDGKWKLPFLHAPATNIATAVIEKDVKDFDEASQWAERVLCGNVATAVVLDNEGILAAWEPDPKHKEKLVLVSRAHRPFCVV